jgi:Domain of unknown function (DUF4184)
MPFTVSHIAAVLPLHRPLRRLGLISAAMIGAMAPDLDLILPIRLTREQTHSWLALLTFCLPVGLAAWALFQALIKPALIEVLPNRIYGRLLAEHVGPRLGSVQTWLYAAFAVLSGALTHVVWDGLTHEEASGVRILPMLEEGGSEPGGSTWLLYRWLQHGSTVLGAVAVCIALWLWVGHAKWPNAPPERRLAARERHRWMALYILIPVLLVALAPINQNGWRRFHLTEALTVLAVTAMRGAALGLVFASALIRRRLLILDAGSGQGNARPEPAS